MAVMYELFGYILIPLMIIGFLGNSLMIGAILYGKLYTSPTNRLLLNLFISGALYACLAMPAAAYSNITHRWQLGAASCKLFAFLAIGVSFVHCLLHAALPLARLLALRHLTALSRTAEHRAGHALVAVTWLLPGVVFLLPFFGVGASYGFNRAIARCQFESVAYPYVVFNRIVFIILPLLTIVAGYGLIGWQVRVIRLQAAQQHTTKTRSLRFARQLGVELALAKKTGIVSGYFVGCFLPSTVWTFIPGSITQDLAENLGPALYLLLWFGIMRSFVVYLLVNKKLRVSVRNLLRLLPGCGCRWRAKHTVAPLAGVRSASGFLPHLATTTNYTDSTAFPSNLQGASISMLGTSVVSSDSSALVPNPPANRFNVLASVHGF